MPLPDPDYLSILELSRRWGCDLGQIIRYVETGKLKAAIEYDGDIEASSGALRVTAKSRLIVYLPDSLIPPMRLTKGDIAFAYSLRPAPRSDQEALNLLRQALDDGGADYQIVLPRHWTQAEPCAVEDWKIPRQEIERFEEAHGLGQETPVQDERPLGTKERTTLLTIIAALAKGQKIDIHHCSSAAEVIERLTAQIGARVSASSIKGHLKRIPEALERRTK